MAASGGQIQMSVIGRARSRTFVLLVLLWIILFGTAGDLAWWQGWAYMTILLVSTLLGLYGPLRLDEGLIEERMSRKPDAKQWDRIFVVLVGVMTISELYIPGLDHRHHWTQPLPMWLILLGLALVILGTAGLTWAMRVNRFFSALIRIQKDRGHTVVSSGPYGIIRHPGYTAWSLRTLGVPLLLGSYWTFIPAGLFIVGFIIRTALEDRLLQRELPGYSEYAQKVRSRLVPGVW
jgi:protein-S-isoprenylcysteine O-methyltransferase Ste14